MSVAKWTTNIQHACLLCHELIHTVHWECYFCCPKRLLLLNPIVLDIFPLTITTTVNMYWQTAKERYLIL